MANRITDEDKIQINELYLQYKTYAEVARQTGFAPSTVKKYVIPNYISINNLEIKRFEKEIPNDFPPLPKNIEEWTALLTLSKEEWEGIEELRKEILI